MTHLTEPESSLVVQRMTNRARAYAIEVVTFEVGNMQVLQSWPTESTISWKGELGSVWIVD